MLDVLYIQIFGIDPEPSIRNRDMGARVHHVIRAEVKSLGRSPYFTRTNFRFREEKESKSKWSSWKRSEEDEGPQEAQEEFKYQYVITLKDRIKTKTFKSRSWN